MNDNRTRQTPPRLIRKPYRSTATGKGREYLVYLPAGYGAGDGKRWPVIFFLHGAGERGDGLEDLDFVLLHGPLGEAWIQHHDLPFIMIGPQLPVFDMGWQIQLRASMPKPERLDAGPAPRAEAARPQRPMARALDPTPTPLGERDIWEAGGLPGGWQLCQEDLLSILDEVLAEYDADAERVYLTGISYGGYGSFLMAANYPERWAAVAPMCGDADLERVVRIAEVQMPIWIFQGGRDPVVKPSWVYDVANTLEAAGHRSVRLTIHEDLGHDVWTRVYAGRDLYDWFLAHQRH